MVKIGDIIKTENGIGKVTDILKKNDGRFVILYQEDGCPHYCIEGDGEFKVIRKLKRK